MAAPRTFDYDEARRLKAQGLKHADIALLLGVSSSAITYAVNPAAKARMIAYSNVWQRDSVCPDCGSQTTRHYAGQQRRCRDCDSRLRVTNVRSDALLCTVCREWKTDDEFSRTTGVNTNSLRRGRHFECKSCAAARRRAARRANPDVARREAESVRRYRSRKRAAA